MDVVRGVLGFAVGAMLSVAATFALAGPEVRLSGEGLTPMTLSAESLSELAAPTHLDVTFMTGRGPEHGTYDGVPLLALLERAGFRENADGHHGGLRRTVLATGRDGYAVAFSIGEMAPELGARGIVLAYARDGQPLGAKGLRIVVPGDAHGARSVSDVMSLELR